MIKNGFGRCGTHSPVSDGEGRPGEKMSDRVLGGHGKGGALALAFLGGTLGSKWLWQRWGWESGV